MNEAEFRTLLRYLKISRQNHYFRILTATADKRRCMKRHNLANQKSQLSTTLKYAEYAKHAKSAETCI